MASADSVFLINVALTIVAILLYQCISIMSKFGQLIGHLNTKLAREAQVEGSKDVGNNQGNRSASTLRAADHVNDAKMHLLLCATGSVATIKISNIIKALSHHETLSIRLIFTRSAKEFLQSQADEQPSIYKISAYKNVDGVYFDEDEWAKPWIRNDSILHIELRRWADLMAVVPLSANSLAKISLGLSDNLFSSVMRAWDTTGMIDLPRPATKLLRERYHKKRVLVAPAMNTAMWEHPITSQHLDGLARWSVENDGWIEVLSPAQKTLACGDTGSGAMKDWQEIVRVIESRLLLRDDGET